MQDMNDLIQRTNIKVDLGKLHEVANKVHEILLTPQDSFRFENAERLVYHGIRSGMIVGTRLQGYAYQGCGTVDGPSDDKKKVYGLDDIYADPVMYTQRSKHCIGYVNDILDFFSEAWRSGFWSLTPGYGFKPHIDNPKTIASAHVALTTNPFCHMAYETGEVYHIPVDGYVYLARTDIDHVAWNHGKTIRTQLRLNISLDMWDTYMGYPEQTI